jgi:hypothetical protein
VGQVAIEFSLFADANEPGSSKQDTNSEEDERLNRCDAVAVMMGGQNDEVAYSKTASLHVRKFSSSTG